MSSEFYTLPENLPVPTDDGACAHLPSLQVPPVCLPSTSGRDICLAKLQQRAVLYWGLSRDKTKRVPRPIEKSYTIGLATFLCPELIKHIQNGSFMGKFESDRA